MNKSLLCLIALMLSACASTSEPTKTENGGAKTEAIKLGAKNVISKPFETENVLRILRAL